MLRNKQQSEISEQRRMPVDNVNSDALTLVTGETVQLKYFNSGVLTVDAGQAAGVLVVGKLANRNVLGALGDVVGSYGDTSLSFTSTAFIALKEFDQVAAEQAERGAENKLLSLSAKATAVTGGFVEGEYCIDHRTGTVYGVKASTQVTLTSTAYSVNIAVSGGGGGISSDVNVNKVGGVAVLKDGDVWTPDTNYLLPGGLEIDDPTSLATETEGDIGIPKGDLSARTITTDGTQAAGEDLGNDVLKVEGQFSFNSISTATTTTVKSGAGHLRRMVIAGGTLGDVTIYDNTAASGTVIQAAATPASGAVILEDLDFATGLTVVTAAATVINTSYR